MARQTGVITFTGKLGNVIGYTLPGSGEHFVRSMPEHVVEVNYDPAKPAVFPAGKRHRSFNGLPPPLE